MVRAQSFVVNLKPTCPFHMWWYCHDGLQTT